MDSPPNLSGFLVNKDKRPPNLEARHITDIQDNLAQFPKAILVPGDIPHSCIGSRVGIAFRVISVFPGQISITSFLRQETESVGTDLANIVMLFKCRDKPVRDRLSSTLNSRQLGR